MKRFWIMLLAIATALVLALPAGAVKPPPKDKPPKPTTSAPIAVYLDVGPMWVHEVADNVYFKVIVHNKTNSPVNIGSVVLHLSYGDIVSQPIPIDLLDTDKDVPAFGTVTLEYSAYPELVYPSLRQSADLVIPPAVFPPDPVTDAEDLIGTATVTYFYDNEGDGGTVAAETAALVMPYGSYENCGFDEDTSTVTLEDSEVCIWTVPQERRGVWVVSVLPDVPRPTNVSITVRDHVPGNWCTLPSDPENPLDVVGGTVRERWKPGGANPVAVQAYLPGSAPLDSFTSIPDPIPRWMWITDGRCLSGGAGGDFFQVGNTESFYLWVSVPGTVTVSKTEWPVSDT